MVVIFKGCIHECVCNCLRASSDLRRRLNVMGVDNIMRLPIARQANFLPQCFRY